LRAQDMRFVQKRGELLLETTVIIENGELKIENDGIFSIFQLLIEYFLMSSFLIINFQLSITFRRFYYACQ
jgi:hypothetical protein